MRIRVKVKHLATVLLLAVLLLAGAVWHSSASGRPDDGSTAPEAASSELLTRLAEATGGQRLALIRSSLIEPGMSAVRAYNVYVGAGSSQWSEGAEDTGNEAAALPAQDKIRLLAEYVRTAAPDQTLLSALKLLLAEYDALDQRDTAAQALDLALERAGSDAAQKKELLLLRAQRQLGSGALADAAQTLDTADFAVSMNGSELEARRSLLLGRLRFAGGRPEEALAGVKAALEQYRRWWKEEADKFPEASSTAAGTGVPAASGRSEEDLAASDTERQLILLRNSLEDAMMQGMRATSALAGTLTRSDGTPVAGAGVFLRAESEVNHSVQPGSEPYETVTDANGHYRFTGVIPGFYQLALGLSFEQIDGWTWPVTQDDWLEIGQGDELTSDITLQPLLNLISPVNSEVITGPSVTFRWEPVAQAAYYSFTGWIYTDSGSMGAVVRQRITDSRLTISTDEMDASGGYLLSWSGDGWETVEPESLLGFANPEGKFSWSIEAYDAGGRLITRSNGYRLNETTVGNLPFFALQTRELTQADRLVLDHKPEEALEAYRSDYAANPQDAHALRMITRIMHAKASLTNDDRLEEAAIPLLKKLLALQPDAQTAFTLANNAQEHGEWQEYEHYYERYIQLNEGDPGSYSLSLHAAGLIYQGKSGPARRELGAALAEDRSHRFVGYALAAGLLDGESLDSMLALAQAYPEHSYGQSGYRWPRLIAGLQAERAAAPEAFDRLLKEKLGLWAQRDNDELTAWSSSAPSTALKEWMKAVLEIR